MTLLRAWCEAGTGFWQDPAQSKRPPETGSTKLDQPRIVVAPDV